MRPDQSFVAGAPPPALGLRLFMVHSCVQSQAIYSTFILMLKGISLKGQFVDGIICNIKN